MFVNYASDDYGNPEAEISSSMARLQELNFDTIELNEDFDFNTPIYEDIKLIARWKPIDW